MMHNKVKFQYPNSPCVGCNKREIGCHSSCEDYISYRNINTRKRAIEYKKKEEARRSFSPQIKGKIMET